MRSSIKATSGLFSLLAAGALLVALSPPAYAVATSVTANGYSVAEGDGSSQNLGTFNGTNALSAYGVTIFWGDGTSSGGTITGTSPNFVVTGSHAYADEGSHGFNFSITDSTDNTNVTSNFATVTVTDADTIFDGTGAVPISANEGSLFSGQVASFSSAYLANVASDFVATINWGDGTTSAGTVAKLGPGSFGISGSHTYADEGVFSYVVTVGDDAPSTLSAFSSSSATVSERDALTAHTVTFTPTEGQSFSGTVGTFTDTLTSNTAGDFSAMINWGDGTPPSAGTVAGNGPGAYNVNGTHTYAEEGSMSVTVTLADNAPGTATATATSTANVADALLTATGSTLTENATQPFTAVIAQFTDADPNGTATDYTATINWGDGSSSTGTVSPNGSGGFNVTGTHTYAAPGTYHLVVTILDHGASATAQATVNANEADLSITSSASPNPVRTHTQLVYKITVKNNGPTGTVNVMLTDTLASASTFISITPSTGCVTPAKGTTGTINCSLGPLASGASITFKVVVFVKSPAESSISNTASVSSSTFDQNLANNSATVTTGVEE